MNLGLLLPIGSSFKDQKKVGQDKRFINYYLSKYNKIFDKVYIFSYDKEKQNLPKNCFLLDNKYSIHRFLYCFLIPFIYRQIIKQIDIFRVTQMTGTIPAIIIKFLYGKPFIFTYGYDYKAFSKLEGQNIRLFLTSILEYISFYFAKAVIVTNQSMQNYLSNKYPKSKLIYLPNGVDVTQFKPLNAHKSLFTNRPASLTEKQSSITILYVGRLERQKNIYSLIKALSLWRKRYKIRLIMIGDGSLKNGILKAVKKFKLSYTIKSHIPFDQMPVIYQNADIFILPSLLEGQPKALLEAMACGLPCIATDLPGIKEFINNKELLIVKNDYLNLSKAIELLINNPTLRIKLGINARDKICKDYNIEQLLKKEISILKDV